MPRGQMPHHPSRQQSMQKSQSSPTKSNRHLTMIYNEILTLLFSGVVTASTIVYVILTAKLVQEGRIMRKAQVEPYIIAYLDITERKADIVYLKTKNIGQGVALNVRFKIEKDINYPNSKPLASISYFKDGINYFPPKREDKHLLFSFQGDVEKKAIDSIIFEVEYESILNEHKKHRYELKFRELTGKGNLIPPDTHIGYIGYKLEKIEKILEKVANGLSKEDED